MTGRRWLGIAIFGTLAALGIGLSVVATQTTGSSSPTPSIQTSVSISESPKSSASTRISSPNPEDSPIPPSPRPPETGGPPETGDGGSLSVSPLACTGELTQAELGTDALPEGTAKHTHVDPYGCVTVYKVQPGDNLFNIAKSFSVAGADLTLYQWNASVVGQNPDLIHPGQVIIVDPTGKVTAPS